MANQKKEFVGYCSKCNDDKMFKIIGTHIVSNDDGHGKKDFAFSYCKSCRIPALFFREDSYDIGFEFLEYDMCVFPIDKRLLTFDIPNIVREAYNEAVKCEKAKASIATVVMVGRALEAICKDFVPETKTINNSLQKMKENGFISEELLEWSNELRFLRNLGVHASDKQITYKDAEDSLDFLQVIIEILYHLRPRFKDIKSRREIELNNLQISQ